MLAWADKWQAAACTTLCLAALAELDAATLSASDVNGMLRGLPEAVTDNAAYAAVKAKCCTWLLQRFKDVWLVVTDKQLLESFCSLSHAAVGCHCVGEKTGSIRTELRICLPSKLLLTAGWLSSLLNCSSATRALADASTEHTTYCLLLICPAKELPPPAPTANRPAGAPVGGNGQPGSAL